MTGALAANSVFKAKQQRKKKKTTITTVIKTNKRNSDLISMALGQQAKTICPSASVQ